MKQFTLSSVSKLGENDETYGQKYWCAVNEQLENVSFNSKSGEFKVGDVIEAEDILLKETKKGVTYHQLKKVRVVQESNIKFVPGDTTATNPSQLDRIEEKLDQLLALKEDEALQEGLNDLN